MTLLTRNIRHLSSDISAAEIAHQLGGDGVPGQDGWYRCRCPAHHGEGLNCSIKLTRAGRLAVRCWSHGCPEHAILRAIDAQLGAAFARSNAAEDFTDDPEVPHTPPSQEDSTDAAALALWQAEEAGYDTALRTQTALSGANRLFEAAKPLEPGDLVDRYLRSRGIVLERFPAALRLHGGLWHRETSARWPGIVARVTVPGHTELVTAHRTFLARDGSGKAPVDPTRKLFSPMRGGAVRLFDPGNDTLLVAEGIETTLAALVLSGWSYTGWAAISTSGLVKLRVPPRFHHVIIAADNDLNSAGLRAAHALAKRLRAAGRRVDIRPPPLAGSDWNDLLIEKAKQGEMA